jgi:pimeloyl-ACP methyl ester carboxylesterase
MARVRVGWRQCPKLALMLRVANDGFEIAFDVTGQVSGPGFVFAQRKVGWDRMGYVDALASSGKVLVVDPRGFGDSTRARHESAYSLDGFCDDVLAAADAVGLESFIAWGYSNTAALAVAGIERPADRGERRSQPCPAHRERIRTTDG